MLWDDLRKGMERGEWQGGGTDRISLGYLVG